MVFLDTGRPASSSGVKDEVEREREQREPRGFLEGEKKPDRRKSWPAGDIKADLPPTSAKQAWFLATARDLSSIGDTKERLQYNAATAPGNGE